MSSSHSSVAGAVFGEVEVSLFVAGAAFGEFGSMISVTFGGRRSIR